MTAAYPHLFQPIMVGSVQLPNRLVMGSMHTGLEARADGAPRLAAFYAERAAAEAGLIITGGVSPNFEGRLKDEPAMLASAADAAWHRPIPQAVHEAGGRIVLQILHSGRYGYHEAIVAPSAIRSPINREMPRAMTEANITRTIGDFATAAGLAREAGYDGVEVMGSEGYLITQFLCPRTNQRDDDWGGSLDHRLRFAVETVQAVRRAVGPDFLVIFRISTLDLVEGGLTADETVALARAVEAAGADMLTSGIGWHEARVPTIAQAVPRGGFAWASRRITEAVAIPVAASNRINTPEAGEAILAAGHADMISMARPFLADGAFAAKARSGDRRGINICIACNQACLDHYFIDEPASCLVNPHACREEELRVTPVEQPRAIAVVGGGPAGLAAAVVAAERGHQVTLFEAASELGGQFNLAKRVPGKQEFGESVAYFADRLQRAGVELRLGQRATTDDLAGGRFAHVVMASGVAPRRPDIPGIEHTMVATYADVLTGRVQAGRRVVIIGAGGIGFDVALFLLERSLRSHVEADAFAHHWGIATNGEVAGGLDPGGASDDPPHHEITMLKRSPGGFGRTLGRSTGWIHRLILARNRVAQFAGVAYDRIDDRGIHITVAGEGRHIPADTIVICAGQDPLAELAPDLAAAGVAATAIGGARLAAELDAERAIEEGTRLALAL